jgi:hypothetical protein
MNLRDFAAILEYRARERSLDDAERERAQRGAPPDPGLYTVLRSRNRRMLLRELHLSDCAPNDTRLGSSPAEILVLTAPRAFPRADGAMSRMAVASLASHSHEPIAEIGFN